MTRGPLRIAQMLESGGPGGAETVLLQLSDELHSRGHQIIPVRCRDGETWLDDQLRERGWEPLYFPIQKPVDWRAARSLRAMLAEQEVDVVHSHEFTMAVYGAAAADKLGLPHVITMHGNQTINDALRRRMALRWAFRRSVAVVAVSEATRKDLRERLGRTARGVVTVPNGVPRRPGSPDGPRREFGIADTDVVVLAVGNLVERKGHIILLRALAQLTEEGCTVPWRLIIAGRGPEREALEALAEQAGLTERVHLAGHRDDVPDLQAAASVLCMPSLWEGLPLAVLEGMHAGNCVIASETSGIPEAITDGANGLLVPPGDVPALAAALRAVLEDEALRARLGAAALDTAGSKFSVAGMADRYEELYRLRARSG